MSRHHHSPEIHAQILKESEKRFETSLTTKETQSLQREFNNHRWSLEKLLTQPGPNSTPVPPSDDGSNKSLS